MKTRVCELAGPHSSVTGANTRGNAYMTTSLELALDGGEPLEDKELLLAVGGRVGLLV